MNRTTMIAKRNEGKVNLTLLIALVAVVLLIGGVVGGVMAFDMFRTSVEERVAMGDKMMADGNVKGAITQYGIALNKRKTDVGIAQKYIKAVRTAPADDIFQARKYLQQLQEWPKRLAELNPENDQLLDDYYALLVEMAERLDGPGFYRQLYELANAKLEHDPENKVARRYRGIAQMQQLTPDLSLELVQQTLTDLEMSAEENPQDADVMHNLAKWKLFEAGRLADSGAPASRTDPLVNEAVEISSTSLAQDPQDVNRQLNHLMILMSPRVNKPAEAKAMMATLEKSLPQSDAADNTVLGFAETLMRTDREPVTTESGVESTRGILRTEKMLTDALEKNPNQKIYLLALGRVARQQNKIDEAIGYFEQIRDQADQGSAIELLRDNELQVLATNELGNLLLARLQGIDDEAERQATINQVRELIEELKIKSRPDSGIVNALAGKLLMAEGKLAEALTRLDRASSQFSDSNPELLLLIAKICRQLGETGVAMEKLEDLAEIRPDLLDARVELAELQLRTRQYSQAETNINAVLERDADHRSARQLSAMLMALRGELREATEIYYDLDPVENPQLLRAVVPLLIRQDRGDEARELTRKIFAKDPTNLQAMVILLRLTPDETEQQAILETASTAGGDANIINRVRQRLNDPSPMNIEEQIELLEDPLMQTIARAELAWRQGNLEQANKLLDEAKQIDPHDSRVLELEFNVAVGSQDWTTARRVVEIAATKNLDLAGGEFWKGRLAAAQGQINQAINSYRQGLSSRPIYSEGHRTLGDLLMRNSSFAEAIEHYEQALLQKPDDVMAVRGLAAAYDRRGENDAALNAIRRAVQIDPSNSELINLYIDYEERYGNQGRALPLRRQLRELDPDNYANRRSFAMLLARDGQVEEAIAQVKDLFKDEGQTRTNVATMAQIYSIIGQPQEGIAFIESYLEQNKDEPKAEDLVLMARYLLSNGMNSQAVEWYLNAMELEDPVQREVSRELADVAFANARFGEALTLYEKILDSKPDDENVRLRLVETMVKLQDYERAAALMQMVKQDTAVVAVLNTLIAEGRGNMSSALQQIDQSIERWPTNSGLYYQRARILAQEPGGVIPAMKDLDRSLSLDPGAIEPRQLLVRLHLQKGEVDEAVRELRALLTRRPGSTPVRLQLFNLYLNRGDYLAASGLIEEAQREYPSDPTWPKAQARVAELQKDMQRLVASWQRAVELAPTAPHIASLAEVLLRNDQPSEAMKLLLKHVDLVNREPLLQALRGRALAASGREEQAEQVMLAAMNATTNLNQFDLVAQQIQAGVGKQKLFELMDETNSNISNVWKVLTRSRVDLSDGEFESAINHLKSIASRIEKGGAEQQMFDRMMSVSLHQNGNYEEASDYYQRLIAANPNDVTSMNNLAFLIAQHEKDLARALPLAEKAAQIAPDSAEILDTLGYIQLQLNRLEESRESLTRSIAIRPLPANLYHMGLVQAKLGNRSDALKLLEQATELAKRENDRQILLEASNALEELRNQ